jgi:hypothetical protein
MTKVRRMTTTCEKNLLCMSAALLVVASAVADLIAALASQRRPMAISSLAL